MQTAKRKKRDTSYSRTLKVNAISAANDDWYVLYPEIKLSGRWLERLGFEPGQNVNVTAAKREIVISAIQ